MCMDHQQYLYTCWKCTKTIAHTGLCRRCGEEVRQRWLKVGALGLMLAVGMLVACVHVPNRRDLRDCTDAANRAYQAGTVTYDERTNQVRACLAAYNSQ